MAAQPPLLAPHLALQAPHLAFIFLALWGLLAPHLALQAPHLAMLDLGPHLVPAQPAAKAPPERAAAVTTAEARVLAILEERGFMKNPWEVKRATCVEERRRSSANKTFTEIVV